MLKINTWFNSYMRDGRREWTDYSFTVENSFGKISEKYCKGFRETFPDVSVMVRRIVQLQKEYDDYETEIINGYVYSRDQNRFINGDVYVPLNNGSVQVSRKLNNAEFNSLLGELQKALDGN